MELPLPKKRSRQKSRIGSKYQADVPSLRSRARARSPEFETRDYLFAYGLAVPITCIACDSQPTSRKRKLLADQSSSYASTLNSRCQDTRDTPIAADFDLSRVTDNGSKDAISSTLSSKDELVTLNGDCLSTEDGHHTVGEQEEHAATILPKKRKKRRGSCWLPKRRVTKKTRLEVAPVPCVEQPAEATVDFNSTPKFVPGRRPESWSETEAAYFRLGIFVFGKMFCEISKFIGSKEVIDVSDYYYSKFVRSLAWCRWKASKSLRCKTAVRGEQILEGWRQVELLRRLKVVLPGDAYREIVKATSDFSAQLPEPHPADQSQLEDHQRRKKEKLVTYVFKLKEVVGLELLEQSIRIGGPRDGETAKRDLTSGPYSPQFSLPPRFLKEKQTRGGGKTLVGSGNSLALRSEESLQSTVSVGENCVRRRCWTSEEIAKDFWERVWPALERKGWRTVERKPTIRSKPKLKFLRPGVDKLHREERGISYFDDLKQVIEAVRNDPHIRYLAEPLLEDPVDDKGDASDALVTEEEIKRGWSDDEDMFTTLDGKRTIVPAVVPSTGARGPDESAQSSSLDLDLNRAPDVNSRPREESASKIEAMVEEEPASKKEAMVEEEPASKNEAMVEEEPASKNGAMVVEDKKMKSYYKRSGFPLGGIDLNLLPPDEECIADAGAAIENLGGLRGDFCDSSVVTEVQEAEPIVDVASPERELNLLKSSIVMEIQEVKPIVHVASPELELTLLNSSVVTEILEVGPIADVASPKRELTLLNWSVMRKVQEVEPISDVASPEREFTLPLGNSVDHIQQTPSCSPRLLDFISDSSFQTGGFPLQRGSAAEASGAATLVPPRRRFISPGTEACSRKRSSTYRSAESRAEWLDKGTESLSVPKKRAVTWDWIPPGLGDLPGNTFFIRMNKAAVVQFSPNMSYCVPGSWWQSTRSIDMKFPIRGLGRAVQHYASNLLSSTCRRHPVLEALLKACEASTVGSRANSNRSSVVPGFQEPRFRVVEACATSEVIRSRDERKGSCFSDIEEDQIAEDQNEGQNEEDGEAHGRVSTQEASTLAVPAGSASFVLDSVCVVSDSSRATFLEDTQGMVLQARNNSHEDHSPVNSSGQLRGKEREAKPISNDEEDRFLVPEQSEQEAAIVSQEQTQGKSIRFRIRGVGERPIVSKERSKRVPRNYPSRSGAPEPNGWMRSITKVWVQRESGNFPSFSGSLNSCITSTGFPASRSDARMHHCMNPTARMQSGEEDARLRVKSEENDASLRLSPSSSLRSWGTDDQEEEILSEDQDEEKPALRAEWKPSCERIYRASDAADLLGSRLAKARKWNCVSRRRGFESAYSTVDPEKKCDLGEPARNDVFAEAADKRIKASYEEPVLRSSGVVENMYRDGNQVLQDREKDGCGRGCSSLKTKDKRSKPRHQIRNVSCERFLTMLYTEGFEEELPVQNRSSEGPFQSLSHHLPHLRGVKPNKVRRRRPSLPSRGQQLVVQQSANLEVPASARPKKWKEREVCPAVGMTRPGQDGRFTVNRTLSDLSAKPGRRCPKRTLMDLPTEFQRQVKRRLLPDFPANSSRQLRERTISGDKLSGRGGSRWLHRSSGC